MNYSLLVIETSKKKTERLAQEIESMEKSIREALRSCSFESKLADIEKGVKTLESKLKETKIKKFKWDIRDYTTARVYRWCNSTSSLISPKKQVSWADLILSQSDMDTSGPEDLEINSGGEGSSRTNYNRQTKKGDVVMVINPTFRYLTSSGDGN